jgi:hypothetical protein
MKLNHSSEGNSCSATQEIPSILYKDHYRVHISPQLVPVLSQITPFQTHHHISLRPNSVLSSHLYLGLPRGLFPWGFLTKPCMYSSPMGAECPYHLIPLDLIVLTMFNEEYKFHTHTKLETKFYRSMNIKHICRKPEVQQLCIRKPD